MTAERFWEKVSFGDCWEWMGQVHQYGHGVVRFSALGSGRLYAHRVAWRLLVGEWPQGDLDHLCRNRRCVNPDHLEPVSRGENMRRGMSPAAIRRRRAECRKGHAFTETNTAWYRTRYGLRRACRTCIREYARQYLAEHQSRHAISMA